MGSHIEPSQASPEPLSHNNSIAGMLLYHYAALSAFVACYIRELPLSPPSINLYLLQMAGKLDLGISK